MFNNCDSNTNGENNSAFGCYALQNNTTGNFNTASGYESLFNNTTCLKIEF